MWLKILRVQIYFQRSLCSTSMLLYIQFSHGENNAALCVPFQKYFVHIQASESILSVPLVFPSVWHFAFFTSWFLFPVSTYQIPSFTAELYFTV